MCITGCLCIQLFSICALVVFAPVVYSQNAKSEPISIRLEGCPSALRLVLPTKFSRAHGPEASARRDEILEGLHANPGRKARYSDVFFVDWKNELAFPQVSVASLGTFISRQGKITEAEWQGVKTELVSASQAQRDRWVAKSIAKFKPNRSNEIAALQSRIASITADRPNSIVAFGTSKAVVGGQLIESHTAAKFIYTKRCLAYVIAAVDGSAPNSFDELIQIASVIDVE